MGNNKDKIKQGIRAMVGADDPDMLIGTVSAVDDQKLCCTVKLDDDIIYYKVRLRSVVTDDTGVYLLPKVDSKVTIARVDNGGHWTVVKWSEVDKMMLKIGQTTIEVIDGSVTINEGNNKGLVKVVELTQKINALEQKVNDLLTALQGVTIPLAPSGTYPFLPIFSPITPLQTTAQADIENPDVTH